MKIEIISIGQAPPAWITQASQEYLKRLPTEYHCTITELPLAKRGKTQPTDNHCKHEATQILARIKKNSLVIALSIEGSMWDTKQLAEKLSSWRLEHDHVCLIIGGPDGLDDSVLERATIHWSLSKLTFPHMLARIIILEQLYRAHCILIGHPYHRD